MKVEEEEREGERGGMVLLLKHKMKPLGSGFSLMLMTGSTDFI